MNDAQNVKIVKEAYAAFGRNDVDAILETLSSDIDWHTYGPDELPMSGPRRGKPEVREFFEAVAEAWSFERFEPRDFVAQGDTVVVLGSYSGTAKPTGKPFGCEWSHAFTVKNGKITRFREYTDTANMVSAVVSGAVRA